MPDIHLLDGKRISFKNSIDGFELVKKISKSYLLIQILLFGIIWPSMMLLEYFGYNLIFRFDNASTHSPCEKGLTRNR